MEFLLAPSHRGSPPFPISKTPYVCHQRYDGGPFLSYPVRTGKAQDGSVFLDLMSYRRAERINPTPLRDNEAFIQTWLYFGFIFEFLCVTPKEAVAKPILDKASQNIVDRVYDMLLVTDGDACYVEVTENTLDSLLEIAWPRIPSNRDDRIKHYDHLLDCLAHTHQILAGLPKGFDHTVKYSISGLCELIAQAVKSVLSHMGIERVFGRGWAIGFLNDEAKNSMRDHGWCPSDIVRAEAKFQSLQAIHTVMMSDKSLPRRDHSRCSEVTCDIYQIDPGNYQVSHERKECSCEELTVNAKDLEKILHEEEKIPLLRLTGGLHDLKATIVESDANTPYVAISHVWADGLGNPHANSLSRCKLVRLRELVSAVDSDPSTLEAPLVWLDTLCCPAEDGPGKQKAIEKIRLVYQRAKHVLVLDAGLMAYASKDQELHEKVVRIFTSGWVRRLWTLQEGALAPSLYFQFADEAVSLLGLRQSFRLHANSVRHRVFVLDAMNEIWRVDAFFKSDQHAMAILGPDLTVLDQALQFRSVSVASDEALCIGTLMSLDLSAILKVEPKEDRMQKVWELLGGKIGGIPALLIFLEEQRIGADGWRWAPKSLLTYEKSIHQANVRIVRWSLENLGEPTPLGLKVRFPGFRVSVKTYNDGKPRHPWPGLKRIPEAYMRVRDSETGDWYMLSDKKYAYLTSKWTTEEERIAYNKLELFPLHDTADTGRALVLMGGELKGTAPQEAIFAFPLRDEYSMVGKLKGIANANDLPVRTERHIMINRLMEDEWYLHDTIRNLAMQLRADDMTNQHLKLYDQLKHEAEGNPNTLTKRMEEAEAFKASVKALREKMKMITAEVISHDQRFGEAIETHLGSSFLEFVWVLIQDFFNHDFLAAKLLDDQVWYVD